MRGLTLGSTIAGCVCLALAAGTAIAQSPKLDPSKAGVQPGVRVPSPSAVPRRIDPSSFQRQVDGMVAMESNLDRAFQEFKREHQSAIQVARRAAQKNRECSDKVYRQGNITEVDRRAACTSGMSDDDCAYRVYEHCQAREMTDYRNSQARLSTKRESLQRVLKSYERGAGITAQGNLGKK